MTSSTPRTPNARNDEEVYELQPKEKPKKKTIEPNSNNVELISTDSSSDEDDFVQKKKTTLPKKKKKTIVATDSSSDEDSISDEGSDDGQESSDDEEADEEQVKIIVPSPERKSSRLADKDQKEAAHLNEQIADALVKMKEFQRNGPKESALYCIIGTFIRDRVFIRA